MKKILLSLIGIGLLTLPSHAQITVTDTGLYSILNLQQQQVLQQWATSINNFQQQLTTAQSQLQQLTSLQSYIGNPSAISGSINVGQLTSQLQNNPVTQGLQQLVDISNQAQSAAGQVQGIVSNPMGLFPSIPTITASGLSISRDGAQYAPLNALNQVYQSAVNATTTLQQQATAVQQDIAATETQMQSAADQATVQKLQAKLTGDQAQLQNLQQQISQANQQVTTQAAVNAANQQQQAQAATEALGQEVNTAVQGFKQTGTEQHSTNY